MILAICITFLIGSLILYACIYAGARADEQSERMFEKWESKNLKK